ncbi:MAG: hypothetical protein JWM90_119 [Thermoleophilia bacterium]|nr:hypothetical protein [Thermoleophilia bacterium]
MTTVSQIIGQARINMGTVAAAGGGTSAGSEVNDGYKSFGGSILRNAAIGAAAGAVIALPTGIGIPLGAGVGAAVGAGSALIRHPKVADAAGDGLKGALAGAAGGALVGTITPFGPVGGAIAGGVGGFLTGTVSSLLKGVGGGQFSIEKEKTVMGRITKGLALGAMSGAAVGAGAGLMFGGIGALPGAIWGAVIGGVGGAFYGASTGVTDAVTGAKGVSFTGKGGGFELPSLKLPWGSGSDKDGGNVDQHPSQGNPGQSVEQRSAA